MLVQDIRRALRKAFPACEKIERDGPPFEAIADRAAHNRHYMARKADVDRLLPGLRVAVEDLMHHASLVR